MTVEIPEKLMPLLEQRAQEEDRELRAIALEILEQALKPPDEPKPITERERVIAALTASGMWTTVSPELVQRYVKTRTPAEREALRERLQKIPITPHAHPPHTD